MEQKGRKSLEVHFAVGFLRFFGGFLGVFFFSFFERALSLLEEMLESHGLPYQKVC